MGIVILLSIVFSVLFRLGLLGPDRKVEDPCLSFFLGPVAFTLYVERGTMMQKPVEDFLLLPVHEEPFPEVVKRRMVERAFVYRKVKDALDLYSVSSTRFALIM